MRGVKEGVGKMCAVCKVMYIQEDHISRDQEGNIHALMINQSEADLEM